MSPSAAADPAVRIDLQFADNTLSQMLFGPHNSHLERLEQALGVEFATCGNAVTITGPAPAAAQAKAGLEQLYQRLQRGYPVDNGDVDAAVRMAGWSAENGAGRQTFVTRKKHIQPRSPGQAAFMEAMDKYELVFGLGPAGTGKTYLAVAKAVTMMIRGEVDRLILSRPAVEAGERLGFLPGDLRDKIDPYLRPLYDALHDMLPGDQVAKKLAAGDIEVAPLAFMRGRTLANSFVILDEAQNTTPMQMKMFLTRLGENSRMVITGDLSQTDLPKDTRSGLGEALAILSGIPEIGFVHFNERDVVRHGLVSRIVRAYDAADRSREATTPGAASSYSVLSRKENRP